jgi:hypothetical protein
MPPQSALPLNSTDGQIPQSHSHHEQATADLSLGINARPSLDLTRMPSDALLTTGKKMATDLKDGLWTFFEDIRQATVGDEPINGTGTPHHRRQHTIHSGAGPGTSHVNSTAKSQHRSDETASTIGAQDSNPAPRRHSRPTHSRPQPSSHRRIATELASSSSSPLDISTSFWRENGVSSPHRTPKSLDHNPQPRRSPPVDATTTIDDDTPWDLWDTPGSTASIAKRAIPRPASDSASEQDDSVRSTPRTSTS